MHFKIIVKLKHGGSVFLLLDCLADDVMIKAISVGMPKMDSVPVGRISSKSSDGMCHVGSKSVLHCRSNETVKQIRCLFLRHLFFLVNSNNLKQNI